jgi:hypothetical protein
VVCNRSFVALRKRARAALVRALSRPLRPR